MQKKILIVDDDESILDAVSLVLEMNGYTVLPVLKAGDAHTSILSFRPDLILMDVLISGVDGRELCRDLKKDPQTGQIPIVMVSAHPSADINRLEHKADDFLAKPFEIEDLLDMVKKYV